MIILVITFSGGVAPQFVLKVCEATLALTTPKQRRPITLGGVDLRLYVTPQAAGYERFVLTGRRWKCSFNLRHTEEGETPEGNVYTIFKAPQEMFSPGVIGERSFLRDMTILMMTANDWSDEEGPMIW